MQSTGILVSTSRPADNVHLAPSICNAPVRFLESRSLSSGQSKSQSQKRTLVQPIPQTPFLLSRGRKPKRFDGMTDQTNEKRVLALDVHPRSFGFVVLEGPNRMLDWGVRSFRTGVNAVKIPAATKFLALLDEFRPSAVLVGERLARRTARHTKMLTTIRRQARSRRIPVRYLS